VALEWGWALGTVVLLGLALPVLRLLLLLLALGLLVILGAQLRWIP
jgi:hypothetical protein